MSKRSAIIVGAGPAGLTAAHELLAHTDVNPLVLELSNELGGIARTISYKGNRIDIGGHRFFSRSDRVMNWWQDVLPIETLPEAEGEVRIAYQNQSRSVKAVGPAAPGASDAVMLVRERVSRIFYRRKFFDYPITLSMRTISNLGLLETARIGVSYLAGQLRPRREEKSLEDFFVNRFGDRLYRTFFKDYTEKVWGISCREITAEWGAQRIKGLSISKALMHAARRLFGSDPSIAQKSSETSLIERFLYPKFGPGQMWQEVAGRVRERGGSVRLGQRACRFHREGNRIRAVDVEDTETGETRTIEADFFFSTMPISELVAPSEVQRVASGLRYRDFVTVGLLVDRLEVRGEARPESPAGLVPDNWIYIQEPDVRVGRLQIFNNWSPFMVADPTKVWIGLEYFCDEGDEIWSRPDAEMIRFGSAELSRIGILDDTRVEDGIVIRMPKTYPAYFGTYDQFPVVREYLDGIENLFLIGRNGMHRYNNQDHSMLTAMVAVENIRDGVSAKDNIWAVNTEDDYHEEL